MKFIIIAVCMFLFAFSILNAKPICNNLKRELFEDDTVLVKTECNDDGTWWVERTLNDQLHGVTEFFYENGNIGQRCLYIHNKRHGFYKEKLEDGFVVARRTYHHGTPVDTHKLWFDNKEQKSITVYDSSGNKNGWCMNWYESGVLKDSTLFSEGNKLEEYLFYESGKPMFKSRMRPDGYILSSESYDPKGKRISSVKKGNGNVIVPNNWNSYDTLTVKDGKVMDPSYHFFKGR